MALQGGTRVGPYEIVALLGSGGSGEVYRARDRRIGREVAIKILSSAAPGEARTRRFEQEARAAGRLSHRGVLAVYDVGEHEGRPYVVSELLTGATLRERLRSGKVAVREAIDVAAQVAHALAAAHDAGIIHRDLKPENLFVQVDGVVKILDFGIAKLGPEPGAEPPPEPGSATVSLATGSGVVLGTAGYMAPEQVLGERVDARADLFALGAILYELLSGTPAFGGGHAVERMHAVLKESPPPREPAPDEPPGLATLLARCLAKDPRERPASARELALELTLLLERPDAPTAPAPQRRRRSGVGRVGGVALLAVPLALLAFALGTRWPRPGEPPREPASAAAQGSTSPPRQDAPPVGSASPRAGVPGYRQLTFGNGAVHSARFTPDGRGVVYGAAWADRPVEVFTTRVESASSQPLGLVDADVLAVSQAGEMAVARARRFLWWPVEGTLARVPLVGGTPRDLYEDVQDADYGADGETLALVRRSGSKFRIEYPAGKTLYETDGWVSRIRFAPDGRQLAFFDHPYPGDDMGDVAVLDLEGNKTTLSAGWMSERGLAWSPAGDEVWFTAAGPDSGSALHAVTLAGSPRVVLRGPGTLVLQDVARDGRVLMSFENRRAVAVVRGAGDAAERDVSTGDLSVVSAVARDGASVLLSEQSVSGGRGYDILLWRRGEAAPLRLGPGLAADLAPDAERTLAMPYGADDHALVVPHGSGEPTTVSEPGLRYERVRFFPDGARILVLGRRGVGGALRWYAQPVAGGPATPLTPEGAWQSQGFVSPDGRTLACGDDAAFWLYPIGAGPGHRAAARTSADELAGWSEDGRVVVYRRGERPARVDRIDVGTGKRSRWKDLAPADPAGFVEVSRLLLGPDGRSYGYTYLRQLSSLYLVDGLR
ncbi:MAG: protein kinase [Myxococcales bacterium]|nr:protein kinase [Myxococcales bacterium]